MVSILPNIDSLQHGRSYTARLCFISRATRPSAPAAGDVLVRAHHLNSLYKFPPNLLLRRPSHNYCCSGRHAQLLLFRRPSPNYCCFGAHRTTAAPAVIALASSSSPIFDNTLDATVPTSCSSWEGVIHFCGVLNLLSHLQKLADFLYVAEGKQPST